jgi:hypothetical protein
MVVIKVMSLSATNIIALPTANNWFHNKNNLDII